nr:hypothetical protein [Sphingobium sp. KCTC 72723]
MPPPLLLRAEFYSVFMASEVNASSPSLGPPHHTPSLESFAKDDLNRQTFYKTRGVDLFGTRRGTSHFDQINFAFPLGGILCHHPNGLYATTAASFGPLSEQPPLVDWQGEPHTAGIPACPDYSPLNAISVGNLHRDHIPKADWKAVAQHHSFVRDIL